MKVDTILNEETKQILSEESLAAIEGAFSEKLKLAVESALAQQDDLYSEKLQELLTAIDKDHTAKLNKVVEAVDKNNAQKLVNVIKKYEKAINEDAAKFKSTLVESISNYLEEFIDEAIPSQAIEEATKNRTAREVLSNLRKVLAVDSALMSESVQEAVVDGKKQIDDLTAKVDQLTKENALLKESYIKTKSSLVLENKIASLSDKKKEYLRKVLSDKSPKFIEENFDYTLRLFEKKEKERLDLLKEEAFSTRKVKADAPVVESKEEVKTTSNPYISELQKYK